MGTQRIVNRARAETKHRKKPSQAPTVVESRKTSPVEPSGKHPERTQRQAGALRASRNRSRSRSDVK